MTGVSKGLVAVLVALSVPTEALICQRQAGPLGGTSKVGATPLRVDGRPTVFAEAVGETGQTVVVIHGGAGVSHDYLRPEWDVLSDSMRVVYYDQRGCGQSERELPYSWRVHLADLERVVRAARGMQEKVVLVGSSWGTRLAILYAAQHPENVSAVVLVGSPRWPDTQIESWRRQLPFKIASRLDSIERRLPLREAIIHDSQTVATRNPHVPAALAGRLAAAGVCDDVALASTASLIDLPKLSNIMLAMPVLVVSEAPGEASAHLDVVWKEIQPSLAQGRLLELSGGGHDPWFTRPTEFFGALRGFLRQVSSTNRVRSPAAFR